MFCPKAMSFKNDSFLLHQLSVTSAAFGASKRNRCFRIDDSMSHSDIQAAYCFAMLAVFTPVRRGKFTVVSRKLRKLLKAADFQLATVTGEVR